MAAAPGGLEPSVPPAADPLFPSPTNDAQNHQHPCPSALDVGWEGGRLLTGKSPSLGGRNRPPGALTLRSGWGLRTRLSAQLPPRPFSRPTHTLDKPGSRGHSSGDTSSSSQRLQAPNAAEMLTVRRASASTPSSLPPTAPQAGASTGPSSQLGEPRRSTALLQNRRVFASGTSDFPNQQTEASGRKGTHASFLPKGTCSKAVGHPSQSGVRSSSLWVSSPCSQALLAQGPVGSQTVGVREGRSYLVSHLELLLPSRLHLSSALGRGTPQSQGLPCCPQARLLEWDVPRALKLDGEDEKGVSVRLGSDPAGPPPSAHLLSLSVTQRIEARTSEVSSVVIFKLRPKGKAGVRPLK